jgi:hypothetical protein
VLRKVATRAIMVAITLSGCDRIFAPEPAARDLIGIYRLTLDSEDFLRRRKGYHSLLASTIELRSDFGISIRNLPDCATDGFGNSNGRVVSGDGKWRLEKAFIGYTLPSTSGMVGLSLPGFTQETGLRSAEGMHLTYLRSRWAILIQMNRSNMNALLTNHSLERIGEQPVMLE